MRPTLADIQRSLIDFNSERGWDKYHSPRNLAMALSVEAAELLELYLWSSDDGPQPPVAGRNERVASEAADVLICLLNLCHSADVDVLVAAAEKIEKNRQKYPVEKSYGRLEKHDEL